MMNYLFHYVLFLRLQLFLELQPNLSLGIFNNGSPNFPLQRILLGDNNTQVSPILHTT